jgi:diguanylate cyclase (GGDEF)-like protein
LHASSTPSGGGSVAGDKPSLDWVDYVHAAVFVLDNGTGMLLRCNQSLRRILAAVLPSAPAPLSAFFGQGAADCILTFIREMPADGSRNTLSVTCPTANGPLMLIMHLKPLAGGDDTWVITVDDRTLFFQSVASENVEETFRGIIQALPIGIDLFDASWRGIFYNAYSDNLYLYDPYYDLEHNEWFERAFPDPEDRAVYRTQWAEAQAALERDPTAPQHIEWRVLCRDGTYRTLQNMMCKIGTHYAFIYWDISERGRLEDELRRLAGTDMLTGIFNRRHFFEQAERIRADTTQRGEPLFLLAFDIDHFKKINDRFGHRQGDEALIAVARIAEQALPPGNLIARFGGEEFVILLRDHRFAAACVVAEQIRAAVAAHRIPDGEDGFSLTISISIGLAPIEDETTSLDQLIDRADQALYAAKRAGRNRVAISGAPEPG